MESDDKDKSNDWGFQVHKNSSKCRRCPIETEKDITKTLLQKLHLKNKV